MDCIIGYTKKNECFVGDARYIMSNSFCTISAPPNLTQFFPFVKETEENCHLARRYDNNPRDLAAFVAIEDRAWDMDRMIDVRIACAPRVELTIRAPDGGVLVMEGSVKYQPTDKHPIQPYMFIPDDGSESFRFSPFGVVNEDNIQNIAEALSGQSRFHRTIESHKLILNTPEPQESPERGGDLRIRPIQWYKALEPRDTVVDVFVMQTITENGVRALVFDGKNPPYEKFVDIKTLQLKNHRGATTGRITGEMGTRIFDSAAKTTPQMGDWVKLLNSEFGIVVGEHQGCYSILCEHNGSLTEMFVDDASNFQGSEIVRGSKPITLVVMRRK